jgi:hypothetical protein
MLSQRAFLLLLVVVAAVATATATDVDSNNDVDTTPKRKRTRRHRNVLQIDEADVSVLNSLWDQDSFGQKNHEQQLPQPHSRTLNVGTEMGKKVMKGMGKKEKGMKEKKGSKKGMGMMKGSKKGMGMMKGMKAKGMMKDKMKVGYAGRMKAPKKVESQSFSFYF